MGKNSLQTNKSGKFWIEIFSVWLITKQRNIVIAQHSPHSNWNQEDVRDSYFKRYFNALLINIVLFFQLMCDWCNKHAFQYWFEIEDRSEDYTLTTRNLVSISFELTSMTLRAVFFMDLSPRKLHAVIEQNQRKHIDWLIFFFLLCKQYDALNKCIKGDRPIDWESCSLVSCWALPRWSVVCWVCWLICQLWRLFFDFPNYFGFFLAPGIETCYTVNILKSLQKIECNNSRR